MSFEILKIQLGLILILGLSKSQFSKSELNVLSVFEPKTLLAFDIYIQQMNFIKNSNYQTILPFNNRSLYNIFCSSLPKRVTSNSIVLYVATNLSEFVEILEEVSNFFQKSVDQRRATCWHPYIFIFETINQTEKTTRNIFCGYAKAFPLFTDVFVITTEYKDSRSDFSLWEMYSVKNKTFCKVIELHGESINMLRLSQKLKRRQNFNGVTVVATAANSSTYVLEVSFTIGEDGRLEFESGNAVTLLRDFAETLNFSVQAMTGLWDIENTTELFDLKGQVRNGIADILISQTVIRPENTNSTYLQPTYNDGVVVFFMQPSTNTLRDIYLSAFDTPLWIYMLLTWLVVVITLKVVAKVKQKINDIEEVDVSLSEDSFLWALGSSTQQGWYFNPSSVSSKAIFLSGYLTGVLCYIAYSAAIVSTLSVKVVPIKTFEELSNSSFKVLLDTNVDVSNVQLEDAMKQRIINCSTDVSLPLLKAGNTLLIVWTEDFYYETRQSKMEDQDVCLLFSKMNVNKSPSRSSMLVEKGSSFRNFFNYKIMHVKERGLNFRSLKRYFTETSVNCLQDNQAVQVSLGLNDVITAFFVLLAGYLLSFTIYIVEKTTFTLIKNKRVFPDLIKLNKVEHPFNSSEKNFIKKWYLRKSFLRRKKLGQRNLIWTFDSNMVMLYPQYSNKTRY